MMMTEYWGIRGDDDDDLPSSSDSNIGTRERVAIAAMSVEVPAASSDTRLANSSSSSPFGLNCWQRAWHKCGLRFASMEAEVAFGAYMHSDAIYVALRWPFFALALAYAVFFVADQVYKDESIQAKVRSAPTFFNMVLFGTAWLLTFKVCTGARAHINKVLGSLALLAMLLTCVCFGYVTQFAPELQPTYNFSAMFNNTQSYGPYTFREKGMLIFLGKVQYKMSYGLFFLRSVTIPVTLMLLGLPMRLYLIILVVPFVTALGLIVPAFQMTLAYTEYEIETGLDNLKNAPNEGPFRISATLVAIIVVYISCVVSSLNDESSRRSLFVLHSAMRSQSETLKKDAEFRGYRDVMRSNREA